MSENFFEVNNVDFKIGGKTRVKNASFSIKNEGDIICLLGPSGIGKTTILRTISGLERITSGSITLNKKLLSSKSTHIEPEDRNISLAFQENSLFPHFNVEKNILAGTEKKINKKKIITKVQNKIGFPAVIKPFNEGSSVNVYICTKYNLIRNLKKLSNYKEIMIEKYIPGREIQVAILGNRKLGAIELKPKRKFYDYKAKYNTNAKTEHIIPVIIKKELLKKVLQIAFKAHKIVGCRGVTRSDFKFYKNKFYILEINTQPGMTSLSLVPEIANYKGISFENLVEKILLNASLNR